MSTSAKRFLTGISITVIILTCVGLLGYKFGRNNPADIPPVQTVQVPDQSPLTIDQPYQITQPSVGLLQTTVPITFSRIEDHTAYIMETDERFQPGMQVMLYNKNGECAPKKGEIAFLEDGSATITLPNSGLNAVRGDVIIADNFMARRLPNSARAGNTLWKATLTPEGRYVAEAIMVGDVQSNAEHFDGSGYVRSDEFVITNPDDRLQSGVILTEVSLIHSDAPTIDAQEIALQRANDEHVKKLIEAINMSPPPRDPTVDSVSCGGPAAQPVMEIY